MKKCILIRSDSSYEVAILKETPLFILKPVTDTADVSRDGMTAIMLTCTDEVVRYRQVSGNVVLQEFWYMEDTAK